MVIMGMRNKATVEAKPSNGRMILLVDVHGPALAIICDWKLKRTKSRAGGGVKAEAENQPEEREHRIGDGQAK